jgi:hypothetical protein
MPGERTAKKLFKKYPRREKSLGKPRKKWLDDVINCMKKWVVKNG